MNFDYKSYGDLVDELRQHGYCFCNYHNYGNSKRCVVLRHDIDNSLSQALKLAEFEAIKGVKSTYFVMLTSDFYNAASTSSREKLHRIQALGHEIGLHFDETAYGPIDTVVCVEKILHEAKILSEILGNCVSAVSMHRPSRTTLEADLNIPGMVNTYSHVFFNEFKYLSDSRRRWREPVEEIIASERYKQLQILTHAFWYHDIDENIQKTVKDFISAASYERHRSLAENITDLEKIVG